MKSHEPPQPNYWTYNLGNGWTAFAGKTAVDAEEPKQTDEQAEEVLAPDVCAEVLDRHGDDTVDQALDISVRSLGNDHSENHHDEEYESARDQSCELIGNSGRNLIRKLDRDITLLAELEDPACQEGNDDRAEHAKRVRRSRSRLPDGRDRCVPRTDSRLRIRRIQTGSRL